MTPTHIGGSLIDGAETRTRECPRSSETTTALVSAVGDAGSLIFRRSDRVRRGNRPAACIAISNNAQANGYGRDAVVTRALGACRLPLERATAPCRPDSRVTCTGVTTALHCTLDA